MTTYDDLISRLRRNRVVDARNGYMCNATALELEAASALEVVSAENATLRRMLENQARYISGWNVRYDLAVKSKLEWRNGAEELERKLADIRMHYLSAPICARCGKPAVGKCEAL